MAKRIVWAEQASTDLRGIDRPIALQVLKTLDRAGRISSRLILYETSLSNQVRREVSYNSHLPLG